MAYGVFKLVKAAVHSLKNGGGIVNGVRQGEGTLHFLARNTIGTKTGKVIGIAAGARVLTEVSGQGLISLTSETAENMLLDKEERGKGVVKGLYRQITDSALGQGTADDINEKATDLAQGAVDGIKSVSHTVGDMASEGVAMAKNAAGNVAGGGQQQMMYADPYTGYMPQQTMMNGGIGQFTGMFNSVPQMIGNMTGNHVTMSNLLLLIASGYMMMGPFGWLGKIGGLLTGNMALKSMRQQPVYMMPQQGYYPQMQQQPYYPAAQPAPQQQEENNPVYRSRHI